MISDYLYPNNGFKTKKRITEKKRKIYIHVSLIKYIVMKHFD